MYKNIIFPWLQRFDAEQVHERTLSLLERGQRLPVSSGVLRLLSGRVPHAPVQILGLTFPNVLGVAAGFDKDVRVAAGLAQLGFGHIEVGTLTPRPQVGNPRPRIFRLPQDKAIINRMGFPNGGVEAAVPRLKALAAQPHDFVVGVSLGKQKETPLDQAGDDYTAVMAAVYPYADYLAVNISSPNTPGLRQLQGGNYLEHLLRRLQAENRRLAGQHQLGTKPLLVKIAPDLSWPELDTILGAVMDNQISGVIATNTTVDRAGLQGENRSQQGGLSGPLLRQRSCDIITYIRRRSEDRLPVIGVGGVGSAADVRAKLDAGASLVQLYTSLVYEGPGLAGRLLRGL